MLRFRHTWPRLSLNLPDQKTPRGQAGAAPRLPCHCAPRPCPNHRLGGTVNRGSLSGQEEVAEEGKVPVNAQRGAGGRSRSHWAPVSCLHVVCERRHPRFARGFAERSVIIKRETSEPTRERSQMALGAARPKPEHCGGQCFAESKGCPPLLSWVPLRCMTQMSLFKWPLWPSASGTSEP